MICDVCGTDKDVQCEILTKGEEVDRIYHLCPIHWVEVYRRCLDDFVENSEYKANTYIKMVTDKLIVDSLNRSKMESFTNDEGIIDVESLDPTEIRMIRPYEDDGTDDE